jgi:hypothetical protein
MKEKRVDVVLAFADLAKLVTIAFGGAFLSATFFWPEPSSASAAELKENQVLQELVTRGSMYATIFCFATFLLVLIYCYDMTRGKK